MSIRIGIGAGLRDPMPAEDYWAWVRLCEDAGLDSIWHSDQLMRPSLEPMVMLAALATATKKLRFGMNALVMAHRDPLVIAKECATIDWLAPGRLLPVFGVGDETDSAFAATGRSSKGRGGKVNEAITLIRRLLAEETVSFEGDHYRYAEARISPRPAKTIPLWIGGESEAAIRRTAALGDGWLGGLTTPEVAGDVVRRIQAALTETGRTIDADHYGVVLPYRIGDADDPEVARFTERMRQRRPEKPGRPTPAAAVGDAPTVTALFRRYVDEGISKFVAVPLASTPEDLRVQTERLATDICPKIEDR